MELLIAKMRADFALVAASRRAIGAWNEEDERTAGFAIRDAIDAKDGELLSCWSRWLARLSARDVEEWPKAGAAPVVARGCRTCCHFARPGRSDGHCGGREDLALVYGAGHPLRVLPADGGVSCARWQPAGAA